MKRISVALMLTGAFVLPAWAHHSGTMFDPDREVTFEGVVNEFQYTNPHPWLAGGCHQRGRHGDHLGF